MKSRVVTLTLLLLVATIFGCANIKAKRNPDTSAIANLELLDSQLEFALSGHVGIVAQEPFAEAMELRGQAEKEIRERDFARGEELIRQSREKLMTAHSIAGQEGLLAEMQPQFQYKEIVQQFKRDAEIRLEKLRSNGAQKLLPETFNEVKSEIEHLRSVIRDRTQSQDSLEQARRRAQQVLDRLESLLRRAQEVEELKVENVVLGEERWLERVLKASGFTHYSVTSLDDMARGAEMATSDAVVRAEFYQDFLRRRWSELTLYVQNSCGQAGKDPLVWSPHSPN